MKTHDIAQTRFESRVRLQPKVGEHQMAAIAFTVKQQVENEFDTALILICDEHGDWFFMAEPPKVD